ncbi:hypothetical protein [Treponema sp. Marseille-Q3903]|jgi:lipoprotein|uniref:hypothetical protein n=1 Tax=Treponema sp. Marseille-Q3903 TaxID=2766703 RepID=UPI0016521173|nr:hypothetical protein [Treponema sp. Marseille-Q3903]MBC6712829.1 hypothetical protein [Treponema sp. Marseille-Q3903]
MKKNVIVLSVLSALLVTLSFSCASKGMQGSGVELNTNKPVIIDYKGAAFGADIPGWVLDAANGDTKNVAKALKLNKQKVWILQNTGDNLDVLKLWTDQVDGRAQISSGIEQTVGDLITAELKGRQIGTTEIDKFVDEFSTRMTNVTLQGLNKVTDYWTKTKTLKSGLKKAKSDDDYVYAYTYLVVFSMDEAVYEKQLNTALNDIDTNNEQSALLRDIVTSKLKERTDIFTAGND